MQQCPDADVQKRERGNAAAVLAALLVTFAVVLWLSWSSGGDLDMTPIATESFGNATTADASLQRDNEADLEKRAEDATFVKEIATPADAKPFVRTRHHVLVRVIDARSKEPVEGAEVVSAPFDETPTQELERESAVQFASQFQAYLQVGQKDKTDAAGRVWIRVRNGGTIFAHKEQRFGSVEYEVVGEKGLEIRLAATRAVSVRVVGADGAPRIRVPLGLSARYSRGEMSKELADWALGSTNDQGELLLRAEEHLGPGAPPAELDVYVRAPGLVSTRASISNGETEVVLRLPAHGSLRVRATGVDKRPLADVPTWRCWLSGDDNSESDGGVSYSVANGRDGVAMFPYVGLGKQLNLTLQCSEFHWWGQLEGPTAAGQEVVQEVTLASTSTMLVRARLLDADGLPLADRRVGFHSEDYHSMSSTDADGRLSTFLRGDDENPRPYTFRLIAMQRGKSLHAFPPVTVYPGRENDLGDLRAIAVDIVATGTFEADAPITPGLQCWVEHEHDGGMRYDSSLFVSLIDEEDAFVVCRTVEGRKAGMRLGVRAPGFLEVKPVPFAQGDTIVVRLKRGADFSARVLLDPAVSWIVERSKLDLIAKSETGNSQLVRTRLVDGEWVCDMTSLQPGVYSIAVEPGNSSGDLAQIDGVRIGANESPDPRLQPWDLRGIIQLLTVRLHRPDGSRITNHWGNVSRRRALEGEWESCASFEQGVAQFLGNSSPADLCITVDEHPPVRRTGVIGTLDLVLPEPIETRLVFDGVAPLLAGSGIGVEVADDAWHNATGMPQWTSPTVSFEWLCEEAVAKAKLTPPIDLTLRVYRVLGENRREELGVVPVSVRDGQKEVRVAVPPSLRAALAPFAKPVTAPEPAAPSSGGR